MTNIVVANLAKSKQYRCPPLYQYNYGMKLKIVGVDLPDAYEVDFANDISGQSITQIGGADGVTIPSQFFTPGQAIYAWLRVHPTADSGVTIATIVIPISPRATITDDEPTPEEQSAIDEAIAALNDAVDKADEAVEHYPTITNGIWYVWDVDSGEYVSTGIPAQGAQGVPGVDGQDGTDGFSPTATVTQTQTGATISITDKQGTTTANITNGQDGSPGQPGTDGTDGVGVPAGGTTGQVLSKASGTDYDTEWTTPEAGGVTDVQVNGTSVVTDGVANVPLAEDLTHPGAVKVPSNNQRFTSGTGVHIYNGVLCLTVANSQNIKNGYSGSMGIAPSVQHESAFYGLAKAAGADMLSLSGTTVGVYPEAQKSAIHEMLNGSVAVTGTTPTITALSGIRYVCGEVSTLDITLPSSGIVDVVFQSGSTATVLTITPPTGVTVRWAGGFDPTALEANTTYEINIMDGLGVGVGWT